jgi:hypothetical protein
MIQILALKGLPRTRVVEPVFSLCTALVSIPSTEENMRV